MFAQNFYHIIFLDITPLARMDLFNHCKLFLDISLNFSATFLLIKSVYTIGKSEHRLLGVFSKYEDIVQKNINHQRIKELKNQIKKICIPIIS